VFTRFCAADVKRLKAAAQQRGDWFAPRRPMARSRVCPGRQSAEPAKRPASNGRGRPRPQLVRHAAHDDSHAVQRL